MGIPLFAGKKPKRRTRAQRDEDTAKRRMTIAITVSIMLCTAAAVGFVMLDKYVKNVSPVSSVTGGVLLLDTPEWYNDHLDSRISSALGGAEFDLVPGAAQDIAENLESLPWLYNVRAMTKKDRIDVTADFRKPAVMIQARGESYYLDSEMMVLDYLPIGKLHIIEVEGVDTSTLPPAGNIWNAEDAEAAIELLDVFARMDQSSTPDKPLVAELRAIDVTNYNIEKKRSGTRQPHIILFAHDGTEIYWGAAMEHPARYKYMEASEAEKLAQLYNEYKKYGTLQCVSNNIVKHIELRIPVKQIPRP